MPTPEDDSHWLLDKKIPVALIATMTVQIVVFAWWGGGFSNRVDQLEKQMMAIAPQSERIIRLETKVDTLGGTLTEIKQLLRPGRQEH